MVLFNLNIEIKKYELLVNKYWFGVIETNEIIELARLEALLNKVDPEISINISLKILKKQKGY